MPGKIFVNYRRDDARDWQPASATVLPPRSATPGCSWTLVDNLRPGQRFDRELEKALAETDVFLAVIGPRWHELLTGRQASGERDFVCEEIAGALQRGIVVIPVLIERTPLPLVNALPESIRDLAWHQAHEIAHARFGRDADELIEAVRFGHAEKDKKWYFAYWSAFAAILEDSKAEHWMRAIPTSMWWGGTMGRTGFNLYAFVRRTAHEVRVDLQIADKIAQQAFGQLMTHRADIEREIGGAITWMEPLQPGKRAQISASTKQFAPNAEKQWPQQHQWMLEKMEAFRAAFGGRIAQLALDADGANIEVPQE